jgi:hypothetical protein
MNPTSKKFISLFLVFSLVMLSANLYAKERRGAKLIVTKKDGQLIEGELITVKPNSLLLLDTEGKDVSIDIADIKVITIVKKSKVGKGALYGLLIGGVIGALEGIREGKDAFIFSSSELAAMGALVFGLLGALLGAGVGAVAGTDKKIQIEGMSDLYIQATMDKLRKKARIRDYK